MDATITNLSSAALFLPGPKVDLAATGDPDGNDVRVWPDITIHDLDSDSVIKQGVLDGVLQVDVAPDPTDAAEATTGSIQQSGLEKYTVANLPTGFNGRMAYATDGRAGAEGGGSGTGTPVVFTNGDWRRLEDLAVVAA